MSTKWNDCAFPMDVSCGPNQTGLTKREYFAAMAMQGLATLDGTPEGYIAKYAVKHADALIEELNKESK